MRSVFRYPGGKTRKQIQDWIWSHRPEGIQEYREPFVGGGGIFFITPPSIERWINDMHPGLVAVYEALRDRPEEFMAKCNSIEPPKRGDETTGEGSRGSKGYDKRLASVFDEVKLNEDCDQAFRYFFVNRTVFGGRVNYDLPSRLYFSNPEGWHIVANGQLDKAAEHIKGTRITCGDYLPLLEEPGEGVWIYADPPYVVNTNLSRTSQVYQHGFSEQDHRDFAEAVKRCKHNVCISYDDDPDGLIRSLYDGFAIEEGSWKYAGTTNDKKADGRELLIMNYEPCRSLTSVRPE